MERAWPGRLCGSCTEPRRSRKARTLAEGTPRRLASRSQPLGPTWSPARLQGAPSGAWPRGGVGAPALSPQRPATSAAQNPAQRSQPPCGAPGPSHTGTSGWDPAGPRARGTGWGRLGITHVAVPQRLDGRQRPGVQRAVVGQEAAPGRRHAGVRRLDRGHQDPQRHGQRGCAPRPHLCFCRKRGTAGKTPSPCLCWASHTD